MFRVQGSTFKVPSWYIFLSLFLIFLFVFGYLIEDSLAHRKPSQWKVKVEWVVDGDTFIIQGHQFVRLKGIDTPEIGHKKGERSQYFAKQALKRLIHLIKKRYVIIKRYGLTKDRYGRYLAYVYLPDGRFVNLLMIKEGYAFYFPHHDLERKMARQFLNAQRMAMDQRRGFWARILSMDAANKRYIGNRKELRFHTLLCPLGRKIYLKHRVYFSSLYEAFYKGYAPCRLCTPWPKE